MPVVRISDQLFERLQRHATPLVDSVSDVLERILNEYEAGRRGAALPAPAVEPSLGLPRGNFPALWQAVGERFNELTPRYPAKEGGVSSPYRKILIGDPGAHYEWNLRNSESFLDVCLHFESPDRSKNVRQVERVAVAAKEISLGQSEEFESKPWGKKWAQSRFRVRYSGQWPNYETVSRAAELMKLLMDRTWQFIG